jgi:hypothetical protein
MVSDVTGSLHWQKPATVSQAAFAANSQVLGSFYLAPDKAHTLFGTLPGTVALDFTTTPAIADVNATLAANGQLTSSVTGLKFSAIENSGSLTGKLPVPPDSAAYSGVVLQKQQVARGFVRGAAAGTLRITPQP